MRYLYNRPFKKGFVSTIVFFALMNLVAYIFAARLYDQMKNQLSGWAPGPRFPDWGVPFNWGGGNLNYGRDPLFLELISLSDGLVLNFLSIMAIAFLVGLVVRWFALRFR